MSEITLVRPRSSFSLLDEFGNVCSRRHFYQKSRPRQPSTPAMERGSQAHDAMERVAKYMLVPEMTAERAVTLVRANPPEGPLPPDLLDKWIVNAIPYFKSTVTEDVEMWFAEDENEWSICGKIDLLSDTTPIVDTMGYPLGKADMEPCVADYKTIGNQRYCKEPWEAAKSLQLLIYCLITGVRRAAYVYLLPSGEVRLTTTTITEENLRRASVWIHKMNRTLDLQWEQAEAARARGEAPEEFFTLAPFGHPFCSQKCAYWSECLGEVANDVREEEDGGDLHPLREESGTEGADEV